MLPVTIKNNQFTNTIWLIQGVLCCILLLCLVLSLWVDFKLLVVLPFLLLFIGINQKTLSLQQNHQFKLNTNGQIQLLTDGDTGTSVTEALVVKGYWQFPHVLMIKLKHVENKQKIYLTLFRSVIGKGNFSNILFGLSQAKPKVNEYHES